MQRIYALGVMSGTSLDGLDLALCEYKFTHQWKFNIIQANTVPYSNFWKDQLKNAENASGLELTRLHKNYGRLIGTEIKQFLSSLKIKPDIIASHGHTVFHQPAQGVTLQIGDGAEIAATTGITTVSDFRSLDVALGGQGAPLVPMGDELFFSDYDYCLNIGGFANISTQENDQRIAFDICPANILLNLFAHEMDKPFDQDGALGRRGKTDQQLLRQLNALEFYDLPHPKSLGKEWLDDIVLPIIKKSSLPVMDKLSTLCEHIADQITRTIASDPSKKTFVTGGGAYNTYLIERIRSKTKTSIIIPSKEIIEYKEAIIFGILGILRINHQDNCLSTVTGAKRNSSSGVIHII
ncbi:MAG: anhydro-N-acetylmuramic acid kinase [Bacteroidales bacterium]|jgi:anhydro-N-acetylmuramic acid kinase|nr:anhydro-N-acetylmuramic acid kinase [Bacteroidales bacterium]